MGVGVRRRGVRSLDALPPPPSPAAGKQMALAHSHFLFLISQKNARSLGRRKADAVRSIGAMTKAEGSWEFS